MPNYVMLLIYFGIVLAFLVTRAEDSCLPPLSQFQKRVASYGPLIIGFVSVVLIYTGLYLYFSTVKESEIEGVQGRYFIPLISLLLPIAILTANKKLPAIRLDKNRIDYILPAIFIVQTVAAIFVIFATNYIPHMQFV